MSEAMLDVVCVGEALVDLLPERAGTALGDVERWTRCPGGSPANVAIGVARLGGRAGFRGVVGADGFGDFLRGALQAEGVDVAGLRRTAEARTGIVFICLDARGERSFVDYRKPSAELLLDAGDVDFDLSRTRAVHFTVNSLIRPESAAAIVDLAARARRAGRLTSCDPNLRPSFWDDPSAIGSVLAAVLPSSDVVKLAEDEIAFCTGERVPEAALERLAAVGVRLPVVTLAERGAVALWKGQLVRAPAPRVSVVDATGAGDGFDAGLLTALAAHLRRGERFEDLDAAAIQRAVALGCEVGAAVVTRLGAVAGLPRREVLGKVDSR